MTTIGTDNTHNVYAVELTAIQMAVTLFEGKIQEYSNVYVSTDNQSTIQTIQSPKQQSGQYIIKLILDIIDKIHEAKPACNIHIEWVPGHKDIKGNEQVDQAVKTAATPNTTPEMAIESSRVLELIFPARDSKPLSPNRAEVLFNSDSVSSN